MGVYSVCTSSVADRTDDDLAGVDAHSNLERRIAGFAQTR